MKTTRMVAFNISLHFAAILISQCVRHNTHAVHSGFGERKHYLPNKWNACGVRSSQKAGKRRGCAQIRFCLLYTSSMSNRFVGADDSVRPSPPQRKSLPLGKGGCGARRSRRMMVWGTHLTTQCVVFAPRPSSASRCSAPSPERKAFGRTESSAPTRTCFFGKKRTEWVQKILNINSTSY